MRKYLVIAMLATVGFSMPAYAQQKGRLNIFAESCPYRAAKYQKAITLGEMTEAQVREELDDLPDNQWQKMIWSCRAGKEARIPVPPPVPANARAQRPSGDPKLVVPRPEGAPMGEYYLCDPETRLPVPHSRMTCGPVKFGTRGTDD